MQLLLIRLRGCGPRQMEKKCRSIRGIIKPQPVVPSTMELKHLPAENSEDISLCTNSPVYVVW